MKIISETEFDTALRAMLAANDYEAVGCVTGPGRSGAVAAVYASHILKVPFIPYGQKAPTTLGRLLIVDTAQQSGKTLRKAARKYETATPLVSFVYDEADPACGRVIFWYESPKPQQYRHEMQRAA